MELSFLDDTGRSTAQHAGRLRAMGAGRVGWSLVADVHGLHLQCLLPFDDRTAGSPRFTCALDGYEPAEGEDRAPDAAAPRRRIDKLFTSRHSRRGTA